MNIELYNTNKPKIGWNLYNGKVVLLTKTYNFLMFFIKTGERNKDYDIVWIEDEPIESKEIEKKLFLYVEETTKH